MTKAKARGANGMKRVRKPIGEYWFENYINLDVADHGLCSLCGNRGIVDTRGRAISPRGLDAGRLNYCICPNGQALRIHEAPLVPAETAVADVARDRGEMKFGEEVKLFTEAVPACVAALRANHNDDIKAAEAEVNELAKSINLLVEGKNLALVITALRTVLLMSMLELDGGCPEAEPEPAEPAKEWVN